MAKRKPKSSVWRPANSFATGRTCFRPFTLTHIPKRLTNPLATGKRRKRKRKEKVLNRPMISQRKEAVLFRRHGHGVRASTSRPIAEPAMSRGGPLVVDKRSFRHARHASFHLINDPFPGQCRPCICEQTVFNAKAQSRKPGPTHTQTCVVVGRSGERRGKVFSFNAAIRYPIKQERTHFNRLCVAVPHGVLVRDPTLYRRARARSPLANSTYAADK